MLTNIRLRYIWCVLTGGILFVSALPTKSGIYQVVVAYNSNRWVHFVVYAAVAAIPVAAWRKRSSVLFSLAIAVSGAGLGLLQALLPSLAGHPHNALADLFGVAAGVLFGANIRKLQPSTGDAPDSDTEMSRSMSATSETDVSLN